MMNRKFRNLSWLACTIGVVCCSTTRAQVVSIFAPAIALATNDGNWAFAPFDGAAGRFQQVSAAQEFGTLSATGGGWILAVAFRGDAWLGRTFDEIIPNLQLNLSTIARGPDALSAIFDQNVGPDDTVVLGPHAVHISDIAGGGSSGFGTFFDFRDHPFFYDPSRGNLLMDFRVYQGLGSRPGGVAVLDAFDVGGDTVSSVFGYGSSVPISGSATSIGLATEFFVVPIPEPQTLVLLIVGVMVLALVFWQSSRRHSHAISPY